MRVIGTSAVLAACALVLAGCGFLKKDRVAGAQGPGLSAGADAGAGPEGKEDPPPVKVEKGAATFSVKRDGDVPEGYGIVPGAMTLDFAGASIVTGSVGGLSVAFESTDGKGLKQSLGMLMVSSKIMDVWYTYEGGETLHFKHPPVPFTLTDGDYPADPHDARGRSLLIGPVVTRHYKTPDGSLAAWIVPFKKFKLEITDASIVDEKLTMSCTFTGESVPETYQPPAVYSIKGSFTITDAALDLTDRD
jgi:hypothetical protein